MATLSVFYLFLSQQTVPGLLQDLMITQFAYGTFRQGSALVS